MYVVIDEVDDYEKVYKISCETEKKKPKMIDLGVTRLLQGRYLCRLIAQFGLGFAFEF